MAYQRPMVTVDQNMTTTPTSVEREQPAFVFGPQYELHRYSDPDEKPGTAVGLYDGDVKELSYPGAIDDSKVDNGYTKLVGDNVVVKLFELGTAALPETNMPPATITTNGGYTMLLFGGKIYVDYDVNGDPLTKETGLNRGLAAGDSIVVTYTVGTGSSATTLKLMTTIADVKYSSSAWDLDSSSVDPEGVAGTLVYLNDAVPEDAVTDSVSAVLADVIDGVYFEKKNYTEGHSPKWQWECATLTTQSGSSYNGVKVNKLYALDPAYFGNDSTYGEVIFADLFLTYRELNSTSYSDTFHNITGASEVSRVLGKVDPDNPLAQGVWMAALNAATDDGDEAPPVYFMSVETDDVSGYEKVLSTATLNDRAYVFAPTTQNSEVIELVRNHVLEMSTKTVKKWRIGAVSEKVPEDVQRVGASVSLHGTPFYAIPLSPDSTTFNQFRIVTSSTDTSPNGEIDLRLENKLVPGDVIRYNFHENTWGEPDFDEYTVKKVLNGFTVEVKEPITGVTASTGPKKIEAYHIYTPSETAERVASISRALASRRILNVFPDWFEFDGVKKGGEFAACAVAGLISATEPQQPITNMSVRGIDNVPMTYSHYSNADLDTIASGGTFIVAQDLPGDKVYVRHQITTAYPDGNLNTAELSITKNVDSISYAFAEVFRPYYGKYNIVPELIAILENLAGNLISQLGGSTSVYGPQLITDQTVIRYVRQNQLMKDHVDIAISLSVPYPCNNIDIVLTV